MSLQAKLLPNIKLVAVAKDEAPYLADWIFHHLYFGFSAIDIHINRTTDNSEEILRSIRSRFPSVNFYYNDWVDQVSDAVSTKIQQISYAQSFHNNKNHYDYILFLDIDEYWTPKDFETPITSHLQHLGKNLPVAYEWLCEFGSNDNFTSLQSEFKCFQNGLVKTLLPSNTEIKFFRCHVPVYAKPTTTLLANGNEFIPESNNPQILQRSKVSVKDAYIIHRMFRSELEYLSSLYRGNPENNSLLKLNRQGGFERDRHDSINVMLPAEAFEKYSLERERFIKLLSLDHLITSAQEMVTSRAQKSIDEIPKSLAVSRNQTYAVLKGINDIRVKDKITAFEASIQLTPNQIDEKSEERSFASEIKNKIKNKLFS
ncbi:hypothetical protein WH50_07180 [Pokkaliibacter plantistimulans]|uniref:Glycosyl transferase family 2 n=1 Tax=Pokkaliibacter plantistimulans TaxID=1635171 RepID=A0ABX5M0Q8_9GAMM|nr:glycosyltransferase family 2 protein [Pokkaliibacter plantistimulans]PXF31979.1 hypothetical protein WH50_07180 [Pokkaliibacter plantistimulans]